jgi:hypothetical protein
VGGWAGGQVGRQMDRKTDRYRLALSKGPTGVKSLPSPHLWIQFPKRYVF